MAKLDNTHKGIALAVIGPSLWGIMGIFVRRLSAAGVGSTDISFLRCLLAGAAFFVILWFKNRELLRIDWLGIHHRQYFQHRRLLPQRFFEVREAVLPA